MQKSTAGAQYDGAIDDADAAAETKVEKSASLGTSPPKPYSPSIEGKKTAIPKVTPRPSYSAPVSTHRSRNTSPSPFGYPFGQPLQNGFFSESVAQTAIRG